jgi:hypothetical protein
MGLRRAMAVLAEEWENLEQQLSPEQFGELSELAAEFAGEGDPGMSMDIAKRITDLLFEWLPVDHPVLRALRESTDRFRGPASRAADMRTWFRLAEALGARLGDPAPTAEEVMREGSEWLLAATAFDGDEVRARGLDPGDPDLILLHRADGTERWPAFQFGPDGGLRSVVRTINRILDAADDPYGAADWWLGRHGQLGDAPARLIGRVPDERLIAVARAVEIEAEG